MAAQQIPAKCNDNLPPLRLPWEVLYIIIEQTASIPTLISWACVCRKANTIAERLLWSGVAFAVQDCLPVPLPPPPDPDILSRAKEGECFEGLEFHLLFGDNHPESTEPDMAEEELEFMRDMIMDTYNESEDEYSAAFAEERDARATASYIQKQSKTGVGTENESVQWARKNLQDTLPRPSQHDDYADGYFPYGKSGDFGNREMVFRNGSRLYEWIPIDAVHALLGARPVDLIQAPRRMRERRRAEFVTSLAITELTHGRDLPEPRDGYMLLKQSIEHPLLTQGAYGNVRRLKIVGNIRQQGWDAIMKLPSLEELWLYRAFREIENYTGSVDRGEFPLRFHGLERLKSVYIGSIVLEEATQLGQRISKATILKKLVLGHANIPCWATGRLPFRGGYRGAADKSRFAMLIKGLVEGGGLPASLEDLRFENFQSDDVPHVLALPGITIPKSMAHTWLGEGSGLTDQPALVPFFAPSLRCANLRNLRMNVPGREFIEALLASMDVRLFFPCLEIFAVYLDWNVYESRPKPDRKHFLSLLRGALNTHASIVTFSIINPMIRNVHYLGPNLPGFDAERLTSTNMNHNPKIDARCLAYYLKNDEPLVREWVKSLKYVAFSAHWIVPDRTLHRKHKTTFTRMFSGGIAELNLAKLRIAHIQIEALDTGGEYDRKTGIRLNRFFFDADSEDSGVRTRDAKLGIALGWRGTNPIAEAHARSLALANKSVRIIAVGGYRYWVQRRALDPAKRYDEGASALHVWRLREALSEPAMRREVMSWITENDWAFLETAEMDGNELRFVRKNGDYVDDGEIVQTRAYGWQACKCVLCYTGPRPGMPACRCCTEYALWMSRTDA